MRGRLDGGGARHEILRAAGASRDGAFPRLGGPGRRRIAAMYSETTRSIRVTVEPVYLEDQSSPAESRYVWAYHVRIDNLGGERVQLRSRHWRITDGLGRMQEVRGPGVVGEQPVIEPGEHYEYTSGTPLGTPSGIMVGSYQMETADGRRFNVAIPAFSLDSPHQPIRLN
jgi:ApaG protein